MKEEAIHFLKNLREKVKVVSHNDVDGLTSLAIMISFLRKRRIDYTYEVVDVPIEKLDKEANMIFLDICTPYAIEFSSSNTLIIDHHQFTERPKTSFYNPLETDEKSYIPCSYLVYEVCSEIEDMGREKWLALLGIVGDKGDKNSELCRKIIESSGCEDELNLASDYIYSATLVEKNYSKIINILLSSDSCKDLLQNVYLRECYDLIQKEISKSNNFIERENNILFVKVCSPYNIKSIVATKLLNKYKNKVVLTYSAHNAYYNISIRTDTSINLGEIIKRVSEMCGGRGGGHSKAAGAKIPKDKFEIFKEEFLSEIEEHLN